MVGCDIWSGAYKTVFTKKRCEDNAKAEGVTNLRFEEGNAIRLPYKDESFDAVTSNYVYHNMTDVLVEQANPIAAEYELKKADNGLWISVQ